MTSQATVPPAVRAAVIERDEMKCQCCGAHVGGIQYSLHHRLPRRMGGRKGAAAERSYSMANLVTVCGSATSPDGCHYRIESDRFQAYDDGWLLRENQDAATEAVLTYRGWAYPGTTWTEEKPQ